MQQIKPMEPQRDREGYWTHPDYPEVETSAQFNAWLAVQGFECSTVMLDGDDGIGAEDAGERYAAGDTDILAWQPSKPEGDGWFIASIHDTEDGPVCAWLRIKQQGRPAYQQRVIDELEELSERLLKLKAFLDGSDACVKLDPVERSRLMRQFRIMEDYQDVLTERVAAF